MSAKTLLTALVLLTGALLTTTNPLHAQAPAKKSSAFEFIAQRDGAGMQLELDLTELINSKKSNNYHPAGITLEDGTTIALEVRPRGKFRRRVSDVPPLKLKFAKKDMRALGLDTLNEVKMVVPASFDQEGEIRLLREYVAYRLYERVSPYFVRARLVHLTLRDNHVEKTYPTVWAILLEHDEELAVRLDGSVEQQFGMGADSLEASSAALNAVFQYMIGNTDWSIADARNIYQFRPSKGGKIIPVPYDFDFSGLVGAPYASPTKESGLSNVRDRVLISNGIPEDAIRVAIETFKSAEPDLLKLCAIPQLGEDEVKSMQEYLDGFFKAIKSTGKMPGKIKAAK